VNTIRIILNVTIALLCSVAAFHLLAQGSFFLGDRWRPETGTLFHGAALYLLACGLILLGAFSGAVAYGWASGTLPMPASDAARPNPAYKGAVITRFWYLVVPAIGFVLLAFLLADKTPHPSLQPGVVPPSGAPDEEHQAGGGTRG
jgi:hypothetical protein